MGNNVKLALFLATSGHSGVDRIMKNLIYEMADRGLLVDLLHIENHGPYLDPVPLGVTIVDLGTSHVNNSLPALMTYLKRNRPAALLSDKDRVNRIALLARKLTGVPTRLAIRTGTTVSIDMKQRGLLQKWIQTFSYRRLYPKADAIIVPSHGVAEDLARIARIDVKSIRVLPNPVVGHDIFDKASEAIDHPWLDPSANTPVILGVGELSARKDFGTLINAFAQVRQHRLCRLIIIGKGKQKEHLQDLSQRLGVDKDVFMPGFIDNPYPYMKRASLLALTSRWEGLGVVLIEALSLGISVVATDCPSGPRELLDNGKFGALVPVGDDAALAAAIQTTLAAPLPSELLKSAAQGYRISDSTDRYLEAMGVACIK